MCTILKDFTRKTAQEDIEVYKIVFFGNVSGQSWIAPAYRCGQYESNDVTSKLEMPTYYIACPLYTDLIHTYKIDIGLHSIKNLEDAKRMFESRFGYSRRAGSSRFKLIKATIPKGSEYYEGFDYINDYGEYRWPVLVSDRLILRPDEIISKM